MTGTLKQQAFGGMQWTGVSSGYISVVQLVQIAVLAYFLSPEEIGTMTMLVLTIWFTQAFSDGGMSPAIIHHKKVAPGLLNTLYVINLCYAVVLYVFLNLLASSLSILFHQPLLPDFFPVAMAVVVIAAFGTQFRVILTKELRFDLLAWQEMVTATVYFLVAVVLASQGFGVWSMVIGYVSGFTAGTLLIIMYGVRYWHPSFRFSIAGLAGFMKFGFFQVGERILSYLNARIDLLLVGSLFGPQAMGIYTIAHSFVINPTTRLNQVISSVMFPVFARLQDHAPSLRSGYLKLVKVITIINTPVLLGLLLVSPLFIPLLFDEQWHEAIYILQILSVYALIRSTGSPAGSLQLAKGRADLGFKWNVFLMICSIPAIYAGAQLGGLPGIAWALLLLQILLFSSYWFLMIRPLIDPPGSDYFMAIFRAFLPGILMALGVWILSQLPVYPHPTLQLVVMILSGVVLFFLLTLLLERKLFHEIRDLITHKYFSP